MITYVIEGFKLIYGIELMMNDPFLLQLHNQFGLGSRALFAVAGVAEQLKVVDVMCAAFRLWHNMIDGEILKREKYAATVT